MQIIVEVSNYVFYLLLCIIKIKIYQQLWKYDIYTLISTEKVEVIKEFGFIQGYFPFCVYYRENLKCIKDINDLVWINNFVYL